MPEASERQKCEKHGIWPCGVCHREELRKQRPNVPELHKPVVSHSDGRQSEKHGGDDERFIVVYYKDIDNLSSVAASDKTHVHFCGGLSLPVAKKLAAYFPNLRVLNCTPSRRVYCTEKWVMEFLSGKGIAVTFDYVRGKGDRTTTAEGREDARWRKNRAEVLRLPAEARAKLAELIRLKVPEAILFNRYYQLDCPEKSRITNADVAASLGCLSPTSGNDAIRAVYLYITGGQANNRNVHNIILRFARLTAEAEAPSAEF